MFATVLLLLTAAMMIIVTPTKISGRQFPNLPPQCFSKTNSCQGLPVNTSVCCQINSIYICSQTHSGSSSLALSIQFVVVGGLLQKTLNASHLVWVVRLSFSFPLCCSAEDLLKGFSMAHFSSGTCAWSDWCAMKKKGFRNELEDIGERNMLTTRPKERSKYRVEPQLLVITTVYNLENSSESILPRWSYLRWIYGINWSRVIWFCMRIFGWNWPLCCVFGIATLTELLGGVFKCLVILGWSVKLILTWHVIAVYILQSVSRPLLAHHP
jgi:hypothetical protein